jgi:hypothetical protein
MQVLGKVILFQDALLFWKVIVLCYNSQIVVYVSSWVPPIITWHICQTIIDCLFPIVTVYIINQFKNHWLFSDALNNAITMSSKLKEDVRIIKVKLTNECILT